MTQFSASTARRLVKAGRIPFLQPNGKRGHLRFPLDLVEQWLREQVHAPNPPVHVQQTSVTPGKRLSGRKPKWTNPSPQDP